MEKLRNKIYFIYFGLCRMRNVTIMFENHPNKRRSVNMGKKPICLCYSAVRYGNGSIWSSNIRYPEIIIASYGIAYKLITLCN